MPAPALAAGSCAGFDQLHAAARGFHRGARRLRDAVHAERQRHTQPARGEHLDLGVTLADDPRLGERGAVHHGAALEAAELAEVDHDVLGAPAVVEAAQLGQTLAEAELAALEAGRKPEPGGRPRAFLPPPVGLALP